MYNGGMRAVLFDFGGTLDSDGTTWVDRFYPIYKENGVLVARADFDAAFYRSDDELPKKHALSGLSLEQTVRLQVSDVLAALPVSVGGGSSPRKTHTRDAVTRRFVDESRQSFSRLKPVIERLAGKYKLGIVSNFYGNLDGILEAEGLRALFGVVADSGRLGVSKPDPQIFLHAARALDCSPEDCLMVGDSVTRDMQGGARAGMKTALIFPRSSPPQAGQDWTVESVSRIEDILR